MLKHLPSPLVIALSAVIFGLSTIGHTLPLYSVTLGKLMTASQRGRARLAQVSAAIGQSWIGVNNWLIAHTQTVHWEVTGIESLDPRRWYLVLSNHVSGLDIPVLQKVFHRKVPFLRFFLKKELIWVPVLGAAWWALDFPFMKRHSQEELEKNPSLRLEDAEATREACAKFRHVPTSILNYVEGTRFSQSKHEAQKSPYRHLLRPKAGGIAHAISAMGTQFTSLLDVTIHYPEGKASLVDLIKGRVPRIRVHVQERPIPADLLHGDYIADPAYRERFKAWLSSIWEEKDALLERWKSGDGSDAQTDSPAPA